MSIKDQLIQLRTLFTAWAQADKHVVAIASSLADLINKLQETPGSCQVIIMFHREDKREPFEESGMVDRFFWVSIASPQGLKADPAARLIEGQAGGKPLYEICESARDEVIRKTSFSNVTTEVTPDYKGMQPLTVGDTTATDVIRLEFCIGVQMPAAS